MQNDEINKCECINLMKEEGKYLLSYENEFFKIYGKLCKDNNIIIKYYGKLKDNINADIKLFIHYGFGNLWTNKGNKEMTLCNHSKEKCFCTTIDISSKENLMFCFMDSNNNWDLNDNSSYEVAVLEEPCIMSKKDDEFITTEEELMSGFEKFIKKITGKLYNLILKIGRKIEKQTSKEEV